MKFYNSIPISSYLLGCWVYHDDVRDILEPFHPLYCHYSKHHNQLPKSVDPSTSCPMRKTPVVEALTFSPLSSLLTHLYSKMAHTLRGYVRDLCLLLLSIYSHFRHYISEPLSLYNEPVHPPLTRDNDISLPRQYVLSIDLQYVNLFDFVPYRKSMKFIETKVTAINCRVLTSVLG